ncbi:MAG: GNAT family N-acetyltransferase, partial [Deltaproteobacteria bacterium]
MIIETLTLLDMENLAALYKQFWGEDSSLENMKKMFSRLGENPNYILL